MTRTGISIAIGMVAGIAAVYLLPPQWLAHFSAAVAICCAIFAIAVRIGTKTGPSSNPVASALLSVINLPEQPLANVTKGWALTIFLASAALLVSLCLSAIIRGST